MTRLSFFEKKEKSDRFRVLSQKGLLERILHKKSSHKSTHTQRERERVVVVIVSAFCFRAQREELSVGVLNMGRPRKDAPPVSSKNKTTGGMMSGKKIDRRKKEFRNLPKSKTKKQKRYGPPSHILKATIAPKFKEMREQHQSYNNTTTNNSSRGVMFNNGGGGGLGGKEEEEFNNNAKKFNEEENEDGEEEAWRECDVVGKKENTSNEGERAGTPTPTPTTLTTTNNTHATGGGGG